MTIIPPDNYEPNKYCCNFDEFELYISIIISIIVILVFIISIILYFKIFIKIKNENKKIKIETFLKILNLILFLILCSIPFLFCEQFLW